MSEKAQSAEAVAYQLANDLLHADGLGFYYKDHKNAATRQQISAAFEEAASLINKVRGQR